MVAELTRLAQVIHDELSGGKSSLSLAYHRSIDKKKGEGDSQLEEISSVFFQALQTARGKEIAQGMSLIGPHRDELRFSTDDADLGIYGSRGQQRTAALSLKLAEASFMLGKTGEHPILLLDDVLSELDAQRRIHLLHSVAKYQQVLITATDLDHFDPNFLKQAELFRVSEGRVEPLRL